MGNRIGRRVCACAVIAALGVLCISTAAPAADPQKAPAVLKKSATTTVAEASTAKEPAKKAAAPLITTAEEGLAPVSLRQFTVDDADGFAIYNGRRVPIVRAQTIDGGEFISSPMDYARAAGRTKVGQAGDAYTTFGGPTGRGGGETCATATVIPSLPYTDISDNCAAVDNYNEVCPTQPQTDVGGLDVVYKFSPTVNGFIDVSLCALGSLTDYDTKLYVYEDSCPTTMTTGTQIGCSEDDCETAFDPWTSEIKNLFVLAGRDYYIIVDAWNEEQCGTYQLDVTAFFPHSCASGVGCQLPDLGGQGDAESVAATSDLNPTANSRMADNFKVNAAGSVTDVCWWGIYVDEVAEADCGPGTGDDFTITYYNNDGDVNGSIPGTLRAGPFSVSPTVTPTGNFITTEFGPVAEYKYEATHAGVAVAFNQCYWIEIVNNTSGDCVWQWQTSATGDGRGAQDPDGTGYVPTPYNYPPFVDFDLAFCLNVGTSADACGPIPGDPKLYESTYNTRTNATDWFQVYNIERTLTNVPYGITFISGRGGTTGCDPTLLGKTLYNLVEIYDTSQIAPEQSIVHADYLGGVLVELGTIEVVRGLKSWFVVAAPGTYFVPTGDDGQIVFIERMGLVVGGVFEADPAGNRGIWTEPPCSVAAPGDRTTMAFSTESAIELLDPDVDPANPEQHGSREAGSFFSDGFDTASSAVDRVYEDGDGPLAFGGTDLPVLFVTIRGVPLQDCNENGINDDREVACFDSGFTGQSGCPAGECPIYDALGSGGYIREEVFQNPLSEQTCIPAGEDVLGACEGGPNGFVDTCDVADCNDNGVEDWMDICGDTSTDCNLNGQPDECELEGNDCNENEIPDDCDIAGGTSDDCNSDLVPDECGTDCDDNGVLDSCERPFFDCNRNGQEDFCDILLGVSNDFDTNQLPDECVDVCTTVWNGFEGAEFPLGSMDGLDSDGDGDEWVVGDGGDTQIVTPEGCPEGVSLKAFRMLGGDASGEATPFGPATASEFFIADDSGTTPPPISEMSVSFDFQVEGSRSSNVDLRLFLNENDSLTDSDTGLILWFASEISTVADVAQGHLNVLGGDGFQDTGIVLAADTCYHAMAEFNSDAGTAELYVSSDGGPLELVFNGRSTDRNVGRVDLFLATSFDNTEDESGTGEPASFLVLDNFEVCEKGAAVDCLTYQTADGTPSVDCDGNNICDMFELARFDANSNGVLDHCEGYCADCNNNFVLDEVEIAADSALDANANGVLDWCELATGFDVNFEDYPVGPIHGIGGWADHTQRLGGGAAEIVQDSAFSGSLTKYLVVKDNPSRPADFSLLFGPRQDGAGDNDIELWSWDISISSVDFGSVFVEILDICEDAPSDVVGQGTADGRRTFFLQPFIDAANTGLEFTGLDPFGEPLGDIDINMLTDPGGDRAYTVTSASGVASEVLDDNYAAGLRIISSRGTVQAFWASTQASLLEVGGSGAFLHLISLAATETQGSITYDAATVRRGGDRQLTIRTDGNFGENDDAEFWFDNFNYQAWVDCDNDGRADEDFLLTPFGMQFDRNGDGIQDNCQDCDDDCPGVFPIPVGAIACLDPLEIVAAGDCNDNGIPDNCDINPNLPFEGMFDVAGCTPDSVLDICFHSRRGGGSCNLNGNGIPDECEGDDCNGDGCLDSAEIALDPALDINGNGIIDSCEADCNHNGLPDAFDISTGVSQDRYPDFPLGDGVPDECCAYAPNGDMDGDDDGDAMDYQLIQRCVGIVAGSADGTADWDQNACGCADLNADGVVDDLDVQVFLFFVTGPM